MSSDKLKILCIGDIHIQPQNLANIDIFLNELEQHLQNTNEVLYDIIVILGDTLHTHEKVYTQALNKAFTYFEICSKYALTFVLIGNHDYINNSQFLSRNHPFNSFKFISEKINIVDDITTINIKNINLLFLPYVPDGKFMTAIKSGISDISSFDIIFGHQLFDGAKMGAIVAENVEKWDSEYPLLISGHIHEKQYPQENLHYTGSCLQHSFGSESSDISISSYEIDCKTKNITLKEIFLDLPIKKIITADEKSIYTVKNKMKSDLKNIQYKILLVTTSEFIKSFKMSSLYKSLLKKAKISFVSNEKVVDINNNYQKYKKIDFYSILKELINDDPDLVAIYKSLNNNQ